MNAIVETINWAGRAFVEFALPMFIQSSVLILILLAVDILLRRRVRAVFRYWLWMLVLVKLVLPPSLGSPVSIGAWLGETLEPPQVAVHEPSPPQPQMPPAEWQPQAKLGDGTRPDDGIAKGLGLDTPLADEVLSPLSVPVAHRGESSFAPTHARPHPDTTTGASEDSHATISWQGMILVAWAAVVLALLLLLLQRAWFVRGLVAQSRRAGTPRLQAALDQCRSRMGLTRPIAIRVSPNASSPAVCGLLRPVILIPQSLAPRLQPHDLQAVLLHELAHIRRGDLWVNLIQTLLQIVYFYNPLLWLANAMIRRVREQAVDEAVLVAMGETAPDYPETLLHVAKLAFHRRPALSLRLIGVVESKSALRSRIKHILARPFPKTARLGLLGLVAVFLIAAVLLPMAKARPLTDRARSVMSLADEEARRLNHAYVGTEHILLALARQEEAVSAKVLANLGADIDTLRAAVNKFVQPSPAPVTRSTLPRMPRAEWAVQYAREEAKALGHDYVGTEHILLGLMRDKEGVAAQVLAELGITQTQIRTQVLTFVQPGRQNPQDNNDEDAGGGALVEPTEAQSSGVVAELPNGVTVELLAYSHLVPRGGLFWFDPQGQETTIPGVYEADAEGLGTILAMRVQPPEAHLVAQLYRGPDSQNIDKPWQLPDTDIWLLPLRDERSFANLRVLTQWTEPPAIETIALSEENLGQLVAVNRYGIASIVDLQVVESFSADMLMNQMGQPSILGTGVATAESMGLQDMAEPPMLQFSYIRERASFQKVIAFLDQEGRTHPVEQVKVDSTGTTCQGRIWPGRLAGILVEASAVRAADVRFRNISLAPARVTEIQIEPAARQEILWKLSYRHFVLEALTNSLHEFCERHGGRFPASLADLQSSHDPDAFRWISTHMAYIGQGKSLDDDPRSVIAYDKTLPAEGRGTYVLYSDGQLEFESPAELAELGLLLPNQDGIFPGSANPSPGDGVRSNAIGKPRFTVHGVVTDASGRPMEGVWVNVDCGFERPQRAGRTLTDEEGRYTLGFESAWVVVDADPYGVGIQPAFVYAQKDGFYETSLCHKGNLAMAGKAPGPDEQRFVAGRAGVVLANEPYELNFVMAPAALLTGQLVGADGRPMADQDLWLFSGQMYPPHQSLIRIRTGSDGTFGPYTLPCTSFRLSCPGLRLAPNDEITFTRAGNWRLTLKCRETGAQRAELLIEDLQGPTDRSQNSSPSAPLAWQRTDRYVPPDPNGFFPDDPQGGKQLDALFQAADKDERPDEEIFSTVRQGLRRTTQHRTLILQWIGNRYIWGKDPQNPRAVEILYHAVPLERHYAVYFGLSVVRNKTPNILRTLAGICMEGQEVGRITWGLGDQREMLLAYISPHLQDSDPAKRQIAEMLVKHFKGELDFEQWQRDKQLEEAKAKFSGELPQFRETLLTGGSGARYEVLSTIQRNRLAEILEDSFVPALRAAGGDADPKVRNEVARIAGYRWVWSAQQQDPNVIELMLKLSSDSNREVRSNAVYYGLSVVRDKSESVIRRLVSLALADQEQNFYGRIVWGLKGPMRADRQLVERVLTRELEDAGTDAERAAVHRLFKDVLGEDAPLPRELSGRVVDPNGESVTGAQVAWIDADRSVSITDGRLMAPRFGKREGGPIVETDERGHFRFEEEPNDGFSLLAAHDAGFALVGSEQFARDRVVRLQRWGRVEGRVAEGREPAGDKIWMGGLPNSTWFEHRRDFNYETLCDSEGRFTFKRVPPGWFEVGYLIDNGDSSASLTSRTPVVVAPGQTATVTLGGEGRPVIGRFVPPPDWEGPIYFGAGLRSMDTVHPERPRPDDYSQMTQRQQQEWIKQWHQTPEAEEYLKAVWHNPNRRHYTFCIADGGTFRIKDVIPGKYSLTVWLEEHFSGGERLEEFGGYSGTVEVPPMDEAYSDEPLDVGDLVLRMRRPLHVGDIAPLFEAQTLDGKPIHLADYRGRFVVLSFWHPASHPELDRLKELHATYGATGKLQIIGLGGSDTLDEVKKFVAEHDIEWPQIYFGQAWDQGIAKQYGLSGLPYILLIDPDGKIVATWLRGQKLTDTVREALAALTQD